MSKYIKSFLTIGIGTLVAMIISFITTPIITRIVGTNTYGQFSIFTMYINIGVMVLCMGLDQGIMRFYYKENDEKYKRMLIRACCIIPIISTIIITIVITLLSHYNIITLEFNTNFVFLLGTCTLFQIISRLNMVQLRVSYKTKEYATLNILQKLLYVIFVLLLIKIINCEELSSMTIATLISYFVAVIVGIYFQRKEWKFWNINYSNKFDYKELYSYSFPFVISMGITTLFQAIDKIGLNIYCNYSEVGIYTSALNIVHVFSIIQTTFNSLWSPMANEHYILNPEDKEFYKKANQIITVIMFILGITIILFKDIIVLLLGSDYRNAAQILPFLIFNPIMYTISETTVNGIGFKKKSKVHILIALLVCITNIIGNSILIPKIGSKGAAISTGISYIIFWALRTIISNKYYKIDWEYNKFCIITFFTIMYALYNTFYNNVVIIILGYIIEMILIIFLYKNSIVYCLKMLKKKGKI